MTLCFVNISCCSFSVASSSVTSDYFRTARLSSSSSSSLSYSSLPSWSSDSSLRPLPSFLLGVVGAASLEVDFCLIRKLIVFSSSWRLAWWARTGSDCSFSKVIAMSTSYSLIPWPKMRLQREWYCAKIAPAWRISGMLQRSLLRASIEVRDSISPLD